MSSKNWAKNPIEKSHEDERKNLTEAEYGNILTVPLLDPTSNNCPLPSYKGPEVVS